MVFSNLLKIGYNWWNEIWHTLTNNHDANENSKDYRLWSSEEYIGNETFKALTNDSCLV